MRVMKGVINLKKDRNCGGMTPYPVYPNMYGGAMPMGGPMQMNGGIAMPMPLPMPAPTMGGNITSNTSNYTTNEINTLSGQINSLEQRVTNLENMLSKSYSTNYNTSNYQMM